MSNAVATTSNLSPDIIEKLVLKGDLSSLNNVERVKYYNMICERVGVDPAMQPFKILKLSGKETLYLDRSGAQQLNQLHKLSHQITSRENIDVAGIYQVTARATMPDGRYTESIGAVAIGGLKGEAYANAIMRAETKAKRRSTLDLLGLGMLDESEVETIPNAISASITDTTAIVTTATNEPSTTSTGIPIPSKGPNGEDLKDIPVEIRHFYQKTADPSIIKKIVVTAEHVGALRTFANLNIAEFEKDVELMELCKTKFAELKSKTAA